MTEVIGADEGSFPLANLPYALQHAVGAAALRCQQPPPRALIPDKGRQSRQMLPPICQAAQPAQTLHQGRWPVPVAQDLSVLDPLVSKVRAACRSLRDGVDCAVTGLAVPLPPEPCGEWPARPRGFRFRLGRFPRLSRLAIISEHYYRIEEEETPAQFCKISLEDAPLGLQELRIQPGYKDLTLALPPVLPHLTVLELQGAVSLVQLDCALAPALKRLRIQACWGLEALVHLGAAASLHTLDVRQCPKLTSGISPSELQQLTSLEHVTLRSTKLLELDVPSCSPTLTHLDLIGAGDELRTVDLWLPGGQLRTALRALSLGSLTNSRAYPPISGWDLRAVPNLTALDLLSLDVGGALASPLGLQHTPHLTRLVVAHSPLLETLDLAPVAANLRHLCLGNCPALGDIYRRGCSQLTSLNTPGCTSLLVHGLSSGAGTLTSLLMPLNTSMTSLDLGCGYTSLVDLNLSSCTSLAHLDLGSVGATLQQLQVGGAPINSLDLRHCSALRALHCAECPQLARLVLPPPGCPLTSLTVFGCPLITAIDVTGFPQLKTLVLDQLPIIHLDVSQCTALEWLGLTGCKQLTVLGVSACSKLQQLDVALSGLTHVDASACIELRKVIRGEVTVTHLSSL